MSGPVRILELRSVRGTGGGPEKTILSGAARTDPTRFAVTVCYLRDARDEVFSIDARAASLPIDYVELIERHSFDPAIWSELRRLIRDRHIDIVHSHDYKTNLLAWLVSQCEPVTALSTVHGWTGCSRRERWVYYPGDKRILARFPKVVAVSGDICRELVRYGARPDRIATVPNGIDPQLFRRDRLRSPLVRRRFGIDDREVVIGAVGRLEVQKRFDVLIDAFAAARVGHPNLRLLIAGDGSLRETLDAHAARLGLGASFQLLGHMNDLVELHHAFDLFVQSSEYEGTPNAVLEAMALETPVIATDVGGTTEVLRNGVDGVTVPPGDCGALIQAIVAVLGSPDAARSRAREARHRVETVLSFDVRMAAVEAIYTDLYRSRHPATAVSVASAQA